MITINQQERDKIVLYLKQEASANQGLVEIMNKLPGNEKVTQVYKNKTAAYGIIIYELEQMVEMVIREGRE